MLQKDSNSGKRREWILSAHSKLHLQSSTHRTAFRKLLAILTSALTGGQQEHACEAFRVWKAKQHRHKSCENPLYETLAWAALKLRALSKGSWKSLIGGLGPNPLSVQGRTESGSFHCVRPERIILSAPSAQHNLLITTALFSTICRGLTAQDVSFVPQTTWSHIPRKGDLHIINTETKLVTSRETVISPHAVGAHIQEQPLRYLPLKRGDK